MYLGFFCYQFLAKSYFKFAGVIGGCGSCARCLGYDAHAYNTVNITFVLNVLSQELMKHPLT